MPLIDIHVLEGVFSDKEKAALIVETAKAFGKVAGKPMQDRTSVRVHEVKKLSLGRCRQCVDDRTSIGAKTRSVNARPLSLTSTRTAAIRTCCSIRTGQYLCAEVMPASSYAGKARAIPMDAWIILTKARLGGKRLFVAD